MSLEGTTKPTSYILKFEKFQQSHRKRVGADVAFASCYPSRDVGPNFVGQDGCPVDWLPRFLGAPASIARFKPPVIACNKNPTSSVGLLVFLERLLKKKNNGVLPVR